MGVYLLVIKICNFAWFKKIIFVPFCPIYHVPLCSRLSEGTGQKGTGQKGTGQKGTGLKGT